MPMDASKYPLDWKAISLRIFARSGGRCECVGECGLHRSKERGGPRRCIEAQNKKAQFAKGDVMLTTAHLNHTPSDCRPENLKAMCQRCHLRYDSDQHKANASATRIRRKEERGQLRLGGTHAR